MSVRIVNPFAQGALTGPSANIIANLSRDPKTGDFDLTPIRKNALKTNGIVTNGGLLTEEQWKDVDDRIITIAEKRMPAVMDLYAHGLIHNLEGIHKLVSTWRTRGDRLPANVDMDPSVQGHIDMANMEFDEVPIPCIFADIQTNIRLRREVFDITDYDDAAREIAKANETILFHGHAAKFLGKPIYGYTTFPKRKLIDAYKDEPLSLETMEMFILAMLEEMTKDGREGPFVLYGPTGYSTILHKRFTDGVIPTLNDWVQGITEIDSFKQSSLLGDGNLVMVEMQSNTVDFAVGFDLAAFDWQEMGGIVNSTRVLIAAAPRLKSSQDGKAGIVHLKFKPRNGNGGTGGTDPGTGGEPVEP